MMFVNIPNLLLHDDDGDDDEKICNNISRI